MPELPEVETIRRGLESQVVGRHLVSFETGDCKVFQFPPERLETLVGSTIASLSRRGKYLLFHFDNKTLIFHLGMTGQITLRDPSTPDSGAFLRHETTGLQRVRQHSPDQHTHLQMHLDDARTLMFRDVRKFGKVYLVRNGTAAFSRVFRNLGIEPMTDQYRLDVFLEFLRNRKAKIKSLLLDQRFVAGVGNIYADEALFEAGIHPSKRARYLTKREKERLFESIPLVLEKGIQYGGTSLRDYINSDGEEGNHQEQLNVYGRKNAPCTRCGELIRKIVVSQRGTHFCPSCQKR